MSRGALSGLEGSWERDGLLSRLLAPAAWIFGAGVAVRNVLYDSGLLRSYALGVPSISVGNLSVGGTGKTPVSAWIAAQLIEAGVRPAVLLRGYGGGDEVLVHARLVPSAIRVADPDRVRGAARARTEGAEVLILDDAFQHRRAKRNLDIVLVAAEQGSAKRLLPAGPLREPRGSLRRAQVLVVTRKSATLAAAEAVAAEWSEAAPGIEVVVAALVPERLERVGDGEAGSPRSLGLDGLRDVRVLAISALGAPAAFEAQLASAGADVVSAAYPDHHAFQEAEIGTLAQRAATVDRVVCTLKDAVKLEGRWPRQAPPLWYLSQAVAIERGEEGFRSRLRRLAATEK